MVQNVGAIEYVVNADTSQLLRADKQVVTVTQHMERGFNQTDAAVRELTGSFGRLSSVAQGVIAVLSANQVLEYADAWQTVSNKLVNSIKSNEALIDVTTRVFDIAQNTRTSLDATATLYGRMERSTRKYNLSAEQLVSLTSTINKGLLVSGATTEEAASTTVQLSQALASGVLRGEEFNSITENGSRIALALADSLGVDIGQLRSMAATGKLTTKVVVDGLLKQAVPIADEFAKHTMTLGQAFTVATNNITKFVGESTTAKSTISGISTAVVAVSENLDTLSTVFAGLAVVMGARFAGSIAASTTAMAQNIIASTAQAKALAQDAANAEIAANSAVRKATADKEAAISAAALAQAEYNVAKGTLAEATALDNLIAKKSAASAASADLAVAQRAQAAAMAESAIAARGASVALNALKGVMAMLGGPTGLILLAAAALFTWYQNAKQAREEAIGLADNIDTLAESYKNLNHAQLLGTQARLEESVIAQTDAIADLQDEVDKTARVMDLYGKRLSRISSDSPEYTSAQRAYEQAVRDNKIAVAELDTAQEKLAKTGGLLQNVNEWLAKGMDNLSAKAKQLRSDIAAITADQTEERSAKGDQLLERLKDENALLQITDKRQRAVASARQKALSAGVADGSQQLKQIEDQAAALYDLQQAEKTRSSSAKSADASTKKHATEQAAIAQKLEQLRQKSELAANSTQELSREQAILNAQQSLGKSATQQQIDLAGKYAAKTWDVTNALKAQQQAKQGQKFAQQEIVAAKVDVNPLTGVAEDPLAKINLQEQQKLDALAKYQKIDTDNLQLYEDAKTAITQQAANQRNQILLDEQARQQQYTSQVLGIAASSFDSMAQLIAASGDETSSAYRALFAISKGFAISQATLNMFTAISNALALPYPANIPAMAQAAASGAQLASTISSISYSGGRRYGGGVSSGNMYRVNESGESEVFQTSGGQQSFIPNKSGKIIPADGAAGGGSSTPTVVVNNYANGVEVQQTGWDRDNRIITLAVRESTKEVARQMSNRTGEVSRGLESGYNVTGKSQ